MKNLLKFALALLVLVAAACGRKENGQLLGAFDRPSWKGINPFGMIYVPSGTLHIGPSDQDVSNTFVQRNKAISTGWGFWASD